VLEWHISLKITTLTFKALEPYLSQQTFMCAHPRVLRSSASKLPSFIYQPLVWLTLFVCLLPLWNSLPHSIHFWESLTTFWKHLQTFYLQLRVSVACLAAHYTSASVTFLALYKSVYLISYLLTTKEKLMSLKNPMDTTGIGEGSSVDSCSDVHI